MKTPDAIETLAIIAESTVEADYAPAAFVVQEARAAVRLARIVLENEGDASEYFTVKDLRAAVKRLAAAVELAAGDAYASKAPLFDGIVDVTVFARQVARAN